MLLTVAVLSMSLLAAAACGSGKGAASLAGDVPLPDPGDVPALTAQQIADLSVEATQPFVTVHSEGGYVSYGTGEDVQSADFVTDWTAPNRTRQISTQRTPDGTNISEIITIGNSSFHRPGFRTDGWQELENSSDNSRSTPVELLSLALIDEPAEVVDWNGLTAYRITGQRKQQDPGDVPADLLPEIDLRHIFFVDASSFLVLRIEMTQTIESAEEVVDLKAPGGRRMVDQVFTAEIWFGFTYLDEPLVIEPPDEFLPAGSFPGPWDDSPPHTPTPPAGFPTPTPSPIAPTQQRAVIGAPLLNPTPSTVPPQLRAVNPGTLPPAFTGERPGTGDRPGGPVSYEHVPGHDRLDIGEITVIYTPCDPGAVIDGPPILIVHTPTGSAAFQSLESGGRSVRYGSTFEYKASSQIATEALENVLGSPPLMETILERSPRSARCSAEFANLLRTNIFNLPELARFVIDQDTVARFEFCETIAKHLVAPVIVTHIPTESIVGIRPGETAHKRVSLGTPSGHQHLEGVLSDRSLVKQLLALAPREARCE